MTDFFDMTEATREQEQLIRDHRSQEIEMETMEMASLVVVAVGVVALYVVLRWWS